MHLLLQLTISNFRSFRTPETISFVAAGPGRPDQVTLSAARNQRVLPVCLMYGPNGGGKSNVCMALRALKSIVAGTAGDKKRGEVFPHDMFAFDDRYARRATRLEVVIALRGSIYRYHVAVRPTAIVAESLTKLSGDTLETETLLFSRTRSKVSVDERLFPEGQFLSEKFIPADSLFLSECAKWSTKGVARRIRAWFRGCNILASGEHDSELANVTLNMLDEEDRGKAVVDLIRRLDLGVTGITTEPTEDAEEYLVNVEHEARESGKLSTRALDLDEESKGTQKLFAFAGPIVDTLLGGGPLVIDEFDAHLHPSLAAQLILLFQNPHTNRRRAQLIVTTHQPLLMSADVVEPDQVWMVSKDQRGASHVQSMVEYSDLPAGERWYDAYVSGRFGAVPYLGSVLAFSETIREILDD